MPVAIWLCIVPVYSTHESVKIACFLAWNSKYLTMQKSTDLQKSTSLFKQFALYCLIGSILQFTVTAYWIQIFYKEQPINMQLYAMLILKFCS